MARRRETASHRHGSIDDAEALPPPTREPFTLSG